MNYSSACFLEGINPQIRNQGTDPGDSLIAKITYIRKSIQTRNSEAKAQINGSEKDKGKGKEKKQESLEDTYTLEILDLLDKLDCLDDRDFAIINGIYDYKKHQS